MKKLVFLASVMAGLNWAPLENVAVAQPAEIVKAPAKVANHSVDFAPELDAATAQLKARFEEGKTNAADLQENLAAIKSLIGKHLQYGVHSIPMNYLLDRRGIIIGKSLRGTGLGEAVAKAVAGN